MSETDKIELTQEQKDAAAKVLAGLSGLGMDHDLQIKIEKAEQQLVYRRFYFPGCDLRLHIEGEGVDDDNVVYIKSTQHTFDPRYIKDYIDIAKPKGFEKHMLYYRPDLDDVISLDFETAYDMLSKAYRSSNGQILEPTKENTATVYSILASLLYFNKVDCFKEYCEEANVTDSVTNVTPAGIQKLINKNNSSNAANVYIRKLVDFIGQSMKDFQSNDIGYLADDNKLAFGVTDEFIKTLSDYEESYKEYKRKLWNLLEGVQNLQLCANRDNSIYQAGGNAEVTVTQMNNCVQSIQNIATETESETEIANDSTTGSNVVDQLSKVDKLKDETKELSKALEINIQKQNDDMKKMFIVICVIGFMFVMFTFITMFKMRSITKSVNMIQRMQMPGSN